MVLEGREDGEGVSTTVSELVASSSGRSANIFHPFKVIPLIYP